MVRFISLLGIACITSVLWAQSGQNDLDKTELKEKIKAYKVSYITEALDLTSDEAAAFWPVYNEFQAGMEKYREAMFGQHNTKPDIENMSDGEVEKMIDEQLAMQQHMLNLKLEYNTKFKKVLPIKKVAKLYGAEHMFRKEMIEKIGDKKAGEMPE